MSIGSGPIVILGGYRLNPGSSSDVPVVSTVAEYMRFIISIINRFSFVDMARRLISRFSHGTGDVISDDDTCDLYASRSV